MKRLKTYNQLFEYNKDMDFFVNIFSIDSEYNFDYSKISKLLEDGIDINSKRIKDGWTALFQASIKNLPNIVEFLLKNGADPNIQTDNGDYPIKTVASYFYMDYDNRLKLIKLLDDYGAIWTLETDDGDMVFDEYGETQGEISEQKQKLIDLYPNRYKEYLVAKELQKFNI